MEKRIIVDDYASMDGVSWSLITKPQNTQQKQKITGWTSYDECLRYSQDYPEVEKKDLPDYVSAFLNCRKLKVRCKFLGFDSYFHQNAANGVPIFDDGKVLLLGTNSWQAFMMLVKSTDLMQAKYKKFDLLYDSLTDKDFRKTLNNLRNL